MSTPVKEIPFYMKPGLIPQEHDVRLLPRFETWDGANRRRVLLTRRTKRRSGESVSPRFANCAKRARCNSGACICCMRFLRRWFGPATMSAVKLEVITFVTIIDEIFCYAPNELCKFDPDLAKDRLSRKLLDSGLDKMIIIGGIDFSFNTDGEGRWPDHWCPHFALLILGATPEEVTAALDPHFESSVRVPRPVKAKKVNDLLRLTTYLVKSTYSRRSSYLAKNGRYNTRDLPLKASQEHEITLFLDQFQPVDRLFLQNIRIRNAKLVKKNSRSPL